MLTIDLAARAVARKAASPTVSRCGSWHGSSANCPCHLDRLAEPAARDQASVPDSVGATVREHGRPLDEPTRRRMQDRLGHDFTAVRVHADDRAAGSARSVQALAYTIGEHVVLDPHRLPAASTERDAVLAHELVHTVQQGPLAARRLPDRVSEPDGEHEREAHAVAGSQRRTATPSPAAAVHRAPTSEVENPPGVSITLREDGRLDVVARGPKAPVVGKPAVGLRRNADGTFTAVFDADEKVVSPAEIPPMLRSVVAGAAKGDTAPHSFRIPNCASLRSIDGTRWMTFDEYRATQMLTPDLMPLTPLLYNKFVGSCTAPSTAPLATPPASATPHEAPHEALPPLLPEGQAMA